MLDFTLRGRRLQPIIQTADHLASVPDLEDALWVATAAPIASLRMDKVFLSNLDGDGDGRIRSDDLRIAIRWTFAHLKDTSGVRSLNHTLSRSAIAEDGKDSEALLAAAARVSDDDTVSLDAIRKLRAEEEATGLSAAGMVRSEAAGDDETLRGFLDHVLEVTEGVEHPLGQRAVNAACLEKFHTEGRAWLDWNQAGTSDEVLTLGPATEGAHAAVTAIATKVDQFFLLCDAVRLDPELAGAMRVDSKGVDLLDVDAARALLEGAPLAPPDPAGVLDLDGPVNPAWTDAASKLLTDAVAIATPEATTLDRASWKALRKRLAAYGAWLDSRPKTKAGDRGADVLQAHLDDETLSARTRGLLEDSEVRAKALAGLKALEKLALYQGGLLPLCRSFVTMPDLYDPDARAAFEQGRLVVDGRVFDLAVRVLEAPRHEKFGSRSPIFVMYVQIGAKVGAWTDEVAVPVTAGERHNLVEGMYGVFQDLDGNELHAHIRKIAVSPISIREALFAPFRRIGEAIQAQADKASAASSKQMNAKVDAAAVTSADHASGTKPITPPAEKPQGMTSQLPMLIAGGGLAIAGLSAALGMIFGIFMDTAGSLAASLAGLPVFASLGHGAQTAIQVAALPVAILVLILGMLLIPFIIYAIPVSIATWLRLRQRDLSVLLEGTGWAINTRQYINKAQARQFTRTPAVSPSSIRRE